MDVNQLCPFDINQEVETKSFAIGYRSAWFRCKIRDTKVKNRQIYCTLEFFDFPDEKIRWNKLYHKPRRWHDQSHYKGKLELMVRPAFPPFFQKSQLPELLPTSEVIAVINDSWKIGDLVDWWCEGCYWSGRISQLLENDQVLIDLPDPPIGEGCTYPAHCKDLRPSLDWTIENGWTIPIPKEHDNFCSSVQLIHPNSNGAPLDIVQGTSSPLLSSASSSLNSNFARTLSRLPSPSHAPPLEELPSTARLLETRGTRPNIQSDGLLEEIPNFSYSGCPESSETSGIPTTNASFWQNQSGLMDDLEDTHISSSDHATSAGGDAVHDARKIPRDYLEYLERVWMDQKVRDSTSLIYPGSTESSIIRLQLLLQKIKWLKDLLKLDFERSDAKKPSWEFTENCATPKQS